MKPSEPRGAVTLRSGEARRMVDAVVAPLAAYGVEVDAALAVALAKAISRIRARRGTR